MPKGDNESYYVWTKNGLYRVGKAAYEAERTRAMLEPLRGWNPSAKDIDWLSSCGVKP